MYHYQNSGQKIEFYVNIMQKIQDQLKLGPIKVILPHDAEVREMQTGRTRIQEFRRLGVTATTQKRQSIADGIEATRQFLKVCLIDSEHCQDFIEALQIYRWKFDKRLQVYLQTPEHDEVSNPCDSLKYAALGIHYNKTIPYSEEEITGVVKAFDFKRNIDNRKNFDNDGFAI